MKLERYITPEYLETQKELHSRPKGYGGRGDKWAQAVSDLINKYQAKSVLDYGCGQGTLVQQLSRHFAFGWPVEYREYDPAITGKNGDVLPAELVVCTDVLEHVEPDRIAVVIDHLFKLSQKALFVVIATRPSKKWLKDGRNAHLIIEPPSWWNERMDHPSFRSAEPPKSPLDAPSREWVALFERLT